MNLFGRSEPTGSGPARPLVIALLEGWGAASASHKPAFTTRTPGFKRFAQRATATSIATGPAPASLTCALAAIAEGTEPRLPQATLNALLRTPGGLAEVPAFQRFVRDLGKVGGDCHILCCLTSSGIEGFTEHAARIAASLSHAGVRVWVHAVLDGRDTAPDAGLGAIREFLDDVAGVEQVSFASICGRTFVLDETADAKSNTLMRDAMINASPQVRGGLGAYIDAENRKGVNDADIKPAADPAYPGMRSDDALLIIHPRPDGFSALLDTLVPGDDLNVPAARPTELSACRRMIGWPHEDNETAGAADSQSRAPIMVFQPARPRLPDILRDQDCSVLITAPQSQHALIAASLEGCPTAASCIEPATNALDAADRAVRAIKQNEADIIIAVLSGVPAQARNSDGPIARRTIEQQDKGLGRLAAIMERRGGTLMALGTDTSLTPQGAGILPCLIASAAHTPATPLNMGTLADIAPTILALAGIDADTHFSGTPITGSQDRLDAAAS